MLYARLLDRRGAGAELAGYVIDFVLWVLEDASNAPLAREMCAANHPKPPHKIGFAQALWSALAVQGESQDELLSQLQQMTFGARNVRGVLEGPCYELRRKLMMACPALQDGGRR